MTTLPIPTYVRLDAVMDVVSQSIPAVLGRQLTGKELHAIRVAVLTSSRRLDDADKAVYEAAKEPAK